MTLVPAAPPLEARWELALPPDLAAVSAARRFVAACCLRAGLAETVLETAVLLTSESVTNAFVHGRSDVRLSVALVPDGLMIEVGDDNSRHPGLVDTDDNALDGRGLHILQMLAAGWGVRDEVVGKTVWFQVLADTARELP